MYGRVIDWIGLDWIGGFDLLVITKCENKGVVFTVEGLKSESIFKLKQPVDIGKC
jgi:hypothetical protein